MSFNRIRSTLISTAVFALALSVPGLHGAEAGTDARTDVTRDLIMRNQGDSKNRISVSGSLSCRGTESGCDIYITDVGSGRNYRLQDAELLEERINKGMKTATVTGTLVNGNTIRVMSVD